MNRLCVCKASLRECFVSLIEARYQNYYYLCYSNAFKAKINALDNVGNHNRPKSGQVISDNCFNGQLTRSSTSMTLLIDNTINIL